MKLTIKQWAKNQQTLGARFKEAVQRGLERGGQRAIMHMQKATEAKKVFDTGEFKRSWRFSLPEDYVLRVYNQAPYGVVIEKGRRAGATMPPPSALKGWVRRKLGVTDDAAARSVAFLVAAKIQRDGIPGKFILRDARADLARMITEEVQMEVSAALGAR